MAVGELKSSMSRKRKRASQKRKLFVSERVEVRSMEEGFLGSWHPGTVIKCGKQKRYVKYDNVLDDSGLYYLVDVVVVPAILDGVSSTICNERGLIRPLPPLKEFGKWDLPFGLCVDVNYQEAWWEGVVFDHYDGMEERSIFFPDLGDEMKIGISQLRITHDWSEVTGDWERRGMWVFLELVEEYEQDTYFPVSVKQIWYDMREKEDFNKIWDWTCNVKDLWKSLVLKVINDYFMLTLKEVSRVLGPSKDLLTEAPELESGEPTADIHLNPESNMGNFHSVLNSDNQLNSKSNVLHDAGPSNVFGHDISLAENHTENGDLSNFLDTDQNIGSIILVQENYAGEIDHGSGCYEKNKQKGFSACSRSTYWQPLILSEVELCPDSVNQYALASKRNIREQLKTKVRKHIAYLGWKIEWRQPKSGHYKQRQYRYTSPEKQGKPVVYMSLSEVCKHMKIDNNMDSLLSQDDQRRMCPTATIDNNVSHPATLPPLSVEDTGEPEFCNVSQLLQREPELYYVNGVPASRSARHCNRKSSRNLKSRPPKLQGKGLPIQLQRSSKRVQKVCAPCPSHQKPQNVLSWLIDCNMVLPRSKVHYRARSSSHPMAGGRIIHDGIKCNCCQRLFSLGGFEKHAIGRSSCRSAAANIVLEKGMSILDCQRQIMNECRTREAAEISLKSAYQDENDGICSICHYGGELILCDKCPSSFHKSCLGLEDIPEGDWFCPSCCCGICRQSKIEGADCENFFTCSQCEHKYHAKCLGKRSLARPGRYLKNWFCGKSCEKIYAGLHKLLGKPIAVGVNNLTWTLLKCVDSESCDFGNTRDDLAVESFSKLNVALLVMHECFEPLKECYSGRDLIEDVLFSRWSKLNRLNFQGFYTVLLERNEEVISVATVRVYGEKVAEVPLVSTRFQYRRLGMCRILMEELEKRLKQLGVERLVLPAAPNVLETWTNSFGFAKMRNSERSQFLDYTFLDFQDTIMCQKLLTKTTLDLVLSTESQKKPHDILSVGGSSGYDQSSSVYQAEEIDKSGTLDLQMAERSRQILRTNNCRTEAFQNARLQMAIQNMFPPVTPHLSTTTNEE